MIDIFIDYHTSYGIVSTPAAIYCMYGVDKVHHLNTSECIINGVKFRFNPVDVLKLYPRTRTFKALKAAAAYLYIKSERRVSYNYNNAYRATKQTRTGPTPNIPTFKS